MSTGDEIVREHQTAHYEQPWVAAAQSALALYTLTPEASSTLAYILADLAYHPLPSPRVTQDASGTIVLSFGVATRTLSVTVTKEGMVTVTRTQESRLAPTVDASMSFPNQGDASWVLGSTPGVVEGTIQREDLT